MIHFEINDNKLKYTYPNKISNGLNESVYNETLTIEKLKSLLKETEYKIDEDDQYPLDEYDGYEGEVALKPKTRGDYEDELFDDMDRLIDEDDEPSIAGAVVTGKLSNPQRVDIILRNTFASKYVDYKMKSDVGDWIVFKVKNDGGKLFVTWVSRTEDNIYIDSVFFPSNTNKITITVRKGLTEVLYKDTIEIYRIPTDYVSADKVIRKTYIPLMKKFIDSIVIRMDPFNKQFVFWRTDNPYFSYSFSSPKKNKIILGLIRFITTMENPTLDSFFEQNNLKHKQGYLQTLLDSAEAAGIFKFNRYGNEILINKGVNYQQFLDSKLRRIQN